MSAENLTKVISDTFGKCGSLSGPEDEKKVKTLQQQQMQAGTDMANIFNDILARTLSSEEDWVAPRTRAQEIVQTIISMHTFQTLTSLIIICHMFLSIHETNQRAAHEQREVWQFSLETSFLTFYVVELSLRIFVERLRLLRSPANWFDILIVVIDIVSLLLDQIFGGSELGPVSVLRGPFRAARSLRILRIIRKIAALRDLYMMMNGMLISLRTITFATLFIFMTLTLFSILAVETLDEVNRDLWASRDDADCERCHRAFSTVMSSNLTFMQTILCGDSWGVLGIPLLENAPWSSVIIIPAFVVVELGLLNVVVAVVVEGQVSARERDKEFQTLLKQDQRKRSFGELCRMFRTMDSDGSGEVDVHELIHSYDVNAEFRAMMNMLDIEPHDLPVLFAMMDKDHSGSISYDEFVQELHALKNFDIRTLMFITRQHVLEAKEMIFKLANANGSKQRTRPSAAPKQPLETGVFVNRKYSECSDISQRSPQESYEGTDPDVNDGHECHAHRDAIGADADVSADANAADAKSAPSCGAACALQSSSDFSSILTSMEVRFDDLLQHCLDLRSSALDTLRQCEDLATSYQAGIENGKPNTNSSASIPHKLPPPPSSTLINQTGASPASLAISPLAFTVGFDAPVTRIANRMPSNGSAPTPILVPKLEA